MRRCGRLHVSVGGELLGMLSLSNIGKTDLQGASLRGRGSRSAADKGKEARKCDESLELHSVHVEETARLGGLAFFFAQHGHLYTQLSGAHGTAIGECLSTINVGSIYHNWVDNILTFYNDRRYYNPRVH